MPLLLRLQKSQGKGGGGWEKWYLHRFSADQKILSSWKNAFFFCLFFCFLFLYPIARATSFCLLPDTFWLRALKSAFKFGTVSFAKSLSPPSIVQKVSTGSKSAKGLKRCRVKSKELMTLPEPASWADILSSLCVWSPVRRSLMG